MPATSALTKLGRYILAAAVIIAAAAAMSLPASAQSPAEADSISSDRTPARAGARPVRPDHRATSPVAEAEAQLPDSIDVEPAQAPPGAEVVEEVLAPEREVWMYGDSLALTLTPVDTIAIVSEPKFTFNPDPNRAVWMSALFPGLGQLYNRRYWKLPIVVGAFMGLGYATSWNNTMLTDYTNAYSDIMDNDPTTRSYMDFFAPTVVEANLDKTWLTNLLKQRKNFYRRNRDLCIICIVGVYLVAMVDAYVDAQLAHFDISPNLAMDLTPTLMAAEYRSSSSKPAIGLHWALTF